MRFMVLAAILLKAPAFWDMRRVYWYKGTKVWEDLAVSIMNEVRGSI
jgi:hypothetical protein